MRLVVLLTVVCAYVSGCAATFSARRSELVHPTDVPTPLDALNHTMYMGSDDAYHYFHNYQMGGGGSFKVARAELSYPPADVFPLGKDEPRMVLTGPNGPMLGNR